MNQIMKKTGTTELGKTFRPSLADHWCQTVNEITKMDYEWNVQLPYLDLPVPLMTSSRFSSGDYFSFTLSLCDEDACMRIEMNNFQWGSNYTKILFPIQVSIGIENKKGDLVFPKTINIANTRSSAVYFSSINKQEFAKSEYYGKDGNFTIYCAVEILSLKETKSGSSSSKITSDVCHNDLPLTQFEELFENKTLSDVSFNVGGRIFHAHKNILAARSKVFAAMFDHETTEKFSNEVDIQDVDPDAFHEVLRYMYSGKISSATMEKMAVRIVAIADKYLLDKLKAECETILMKNMSADNCVELLAVADQPHPASHLKEYAVDFLRRFPALVTATDGWKKAKEEKPDWFCELIEMLCL